MSIVEDLIASARADIDLLRVRDSQGDVFAARRPVEFIFVSEDEQQALAVAGFLKDVQYADTKIMMDGRAFRIVATIETSLEQHGILSISGFMQCVSALFSVTYDGWGAVIRNA